jgi:D-3-phosphoglycerate dehydrogenase / 2-oxoglutarate reductase
VKVISLLDDREGLNTISASAEFTFKLLLDALRLPPARELQDTTVGLVGYGRIGKRLWKWCLDFGAEVYYHDPNVLGSAPIKYIFECDAAIICCALTPETRGMITADLLRLLPQGAAVINTARGEIINEADLLTVMDERPDLRVAVDVVSGMVDGTAKPEELTRRGAIVTNHQAGATYDSRTKAARIILNLLRKELL